MRKVILGVFDKMIDYDLKSILIPTFSNSVSKFPDELFTEILEEEIYNFCQENQKEMEGRTIIICQRNTNEYEYEVPPKPRKKTRSESKNSYQEETKDIQPEEQEMGQIRLRDYQNLQEEIESLRKRNKELEFEMEEINNKLSEKRSKIKELKKTVSSLEQTSDQNATKKEEYYNKYKHYKKLYKNEVEDEEGED